MVIKKKTKLGNAFHFKDHISKERNSCVVDKIKFGLCNDCCCVVYVRDLKITTG